MTTNNTTIRSRALVSYATESGRPRQLANAVEVTLHSTPIFAYSQNNYPTFVLFTGGWFTATTKRRMNECLREYGIPFKVIQHRNRWLLYNTQTCSTYDIIGNGIAVLEHAQPPPMAITRAIHRGPRILR